MKLAGCAIFDPQGRILLLHRHAPEQWELPGGKIEPGESARAAAQREAEEELGVDIEVGPQLTLNHFEQSGAEHEYTVFVASVLSGTPAAQEARLHSHCAYWELSDLTGQPVSPNVEVLATKVANGSVKLHQWKTT